MVHIAKMSLHIERWRSMRFIAVALPLAGLLATLALIVARPAGTRIQQRITTSGDPADLEVVEVRPSQRRGLRAHRVVTRG